ncbi:MAG: GNAT family N-acetyltransferase [Chloroflexota bacterium]
MNFQTSIPTPRTLRIRLVTRDDLPELEWGGEYIHFRRLYAEAYRLSERGDTLMWLADLEAVGVIGQAFVSLRSGRAELSDGRSRAYVYAFRVKPPYRGQGVGTKIMETIEADLLRRGYQRVTLNVAKGNAGARRLYERLGYRVIGSDPGCWSYIDHQGRQQRVIEPAWRMEKVLKVADLRV